MVTAPTRDRMSATVVAFEDVNLVKKRATGTLLPELIMLRIGTAERVGRAAEICRIIRSKQHRTTRIGEFNNQLEPIVFRSRAKRFNSPRSSPSRYCLTGSDKEVFEEYFRFASVYIRAEMAR